MSFVDSSHRLAIPRGEATSPLLATAVRVDLPLLTEVRSKHLGRGNGVDFCVAGSVPSDPGRTFRFIAKRCFQSSTGLTAESLNKLSSTRR